MENIANAITSALCETGWSVDTVTGSGTKEFLTGVGYKQAIIYVRVVGSTPGEPLAHLFAHYESEGRNIVSTEFRTMKSVDEIKDMVQSLSAAITFAVKNSYAGRLAEGREPLERIQMVAAEAYADGFDQIFFKDEVENSGDGMLKFLMVELSEKEDCLTPGDAISRLDTAIVQLNRVRDAVEELT